MSRALRGGAFNEDFKVDALARPVDPQGAEVHPTPRGHDDRRRAGGRATPHGGLRGRRREQLRARGHGAVVHGAKSDLGSSRRKQELAALIEELDAQSAVKRAPNGRVALRLFDDAERS